MLSLTRFRNCMTTSSSKVHHDSGKEHHLRAELTHPLSVDQNLPASSYGFVKGKHEYFPFPKDVIDLNKELHQLNGWANN